MTGPEHFLEAERWLNTARNAYLDDSNDSGNREDYATEADYFEAVKSSNELHEQMLGEVAVFAALGQAHAALAQAAAFALVANEDPPPLDGQAWYDVAGTKPERES